MATKLANININDSSSWNSFLDLIYPTGSIYISAKTTSPSSVFGGTWSKLNSAAILMGSSNQGNEYDGQATIGNYAGSTYISIDKMPKHSHTITTFDNPLYSTSITSSGVTVACDWSTRTSSTVGGKGISPITTAFICGKELHKQIGGGLNGHLG